MVTSYKGCYIVLARMQRLKDGKELSNKEKVDSGEYCINFTPETAYEDLQWVKEMNAKEHGKDGDSWDQFFMVTLLNRWEIEIPEYVFMIFAIAPSGAFDILLKTDPSKYIDEDRARFKKMSEK